MRSPWHLIGNAEARLDLIWSYSRRFCCVQLFCNQKSGVFQMAGSLQGYGLSMAAQRRKVNL